MDNDIYIKKYKQPIPFLQPTVQYILDAYLYACLHCMYTFATTFTFFSTVKGKFITLRYILDNDFMKIILRYTR